MPDPFTLPAVPDELAEIIALHKSMFGGFTMMADTPPADGAAQPDPGATPDPKPDATDWKAESRKWEDRAKANKDAADRLAQLEDANKSELQKAQDATVKAQQEAEQARQELARERIARKHMLSDEDTELLSGDEEQMERLAARIALAATPPFLTSAEMSFSI